MSELLRFSDYDVFAYLATGLAALLVADLSCGSTFVVGATWTVASAAITLVGAYVLGQIIASPAAWIVQEWVTNRVLFRPTEILMGSRRLNGWRRALKRTVLGSYYSPLNEWVQADLRVAARNKCGRDVSGESLFWVAFPVARVDEIAYARMESFLRLYGFCRNLTFVAGCGALIFATRCGLHWWQGDTHLASEALRYAALAAVLGAGLFHRYLKFYRAYAQEVLVAFAARRGSSESVGTKPTA